MTDVEIIKSLNSKNYLSFSVSGHSGYSEEGNDIVCSAISFLTINTINSLEKFTNDKITVKQDNENAIIRCEFEHSPSFEAQILMKAFELGITDLASKKGCYGDFVNLMIKEV